jgi:hypothetical protein
MRGGPDKILGFAIQQAQLTDGPSNKFVFDPNITVPGYNNNMGLNHKERLASQRNIPFKLVNKAQPNAITLQGQEEGVFTQGGLAFLPKHFGSLWKGDK